MGAAIGVRGDVVERAQALQEAGADVLVLDIAHGHSERAIEALGRVSEAVGGRTEVVAGNVATGDGARDLVDGRRRRGEGGGRARARSARRGWWPASACPSSPP